MEGKDKDRKKLILKPKEVNIWYQKIYKALQTLFLSGAFLCVFHHLNGVSTSVGIIALIGLLMLCGVFCFSGELKIIQITTVAVSGVTLLYSLFTTGVRGLVEGVIYSINQIILGYNLKFEHSFDLLFSSEVTQKTIDNFFLLVVCLSTIGISRAVYKKQFGRLIFLLIICNILCIFLKRGVTVTQFFIFLSIASLWLEAVNKNFYRTQLTWIVVLAVIAGGFALAVGNSRVNSIVQMREGMRNGVKEFRYGSDSLPEGNLYEADMLGTGDDKTLTVTTGQIKTEYLKGFVGCSYEGGVWKSFTSDKYAYKYQGMIRWLRKHDFIVPQQYARYEQVGGEPSAVNKIKIENTGANRKYIYMPYSASLSDDSGMRLVQDIGYQSSKIKGSKKYEYEEYSSNNPAEILNIADWVDNASNASQKGFLNTESVYRNFVYDQYLAIDEETRKQCNQIFWNDVDKKDKKTIYASVKRIRSVLESEFVYDKYPASASNEDPLEEFLLGNRTGNALHYTTAAVMALRANGIPARYVEGYWLSESKILAANGNKIELHDEDAHVWTEVYMDTMGWLPIDFTPGCYYDTYALLDMVKTPKDTLKTAQIDDSDDSMANNMSGDNSFDDVAKNVQEKIIFTLQAFFGIIALLFLILIAGVIAMEIRRAVILYRRKKEYEQADEDGRIKLLCCQVLDSIARLGIEASFGWHIQETENMLREKVSSIHEGDYQRVNEIVGKYIYGKQKLLPYEQHVLERFIDKIRNEKIKLSWKNKMKTRWFL